MGEMKISELIEELRRLLAEHGDIPVQTQTGYDASPIELLPDYIGIASGRGTFDGACEKAVDIGL
jgi:hypothetical protein